MKDFIAISLYPDLSATRLCSWRGHREQLWGWVGTKMMMTKATTPTWQKASSAREQSMFYTSLCRQAYALCIGGRQESVGCWSVFFVTSTTEHCCSFLCFSSRGGTSPVETIRCVYVSDKTNLCHETFYSTWSVDSLLLLFLFLCFLLGFFLPIILLPLSWEDRRHQLQQINKFQFCKQTLSNPHLCVKDSATTVHSRNLLIRGACRWGHTFMCLTQCSVDYRMRAKQGSLSAFRPRLHHMINAWALFACTWFEGPQCCLRCCPQRSWQWQQRQWQPRGLNIMF